MYHLQPVLATIAVGSQYALIHVTLGFTTAFTPATSHLRSIAVAAILALALSIQIAVQHAANIPNPVRGILALGAWIQVFNSLDILLHTRITYAEHIQWVKEKKKQRGGLELTPAVTALQFSLTIPNNLRRVGTKWQITPLYSFNSGSSPGTIPGRAEFLAARWKSIFLLSGTAAFLFIACSHLNWIPKQRDLLLLDLEQQGSLLDTSWESLLTQLHPVLFFIITLFMLHKTLYNLISIAAVSLHLSYPANWPPFQASPREAWTVRRFWGQFWHQCFRAFLAANADFFIPSTRRPSPSPSPRGGRRRRRTMTIPSQYARYFICFAISGLIHHLLDLAAGIRPRDSGAMQFFLVQPIAFAVEDVAAYLATRCIPASIRDEVATTTTTTTTTRVIGYFWVMAFSLWSWRPWALPVLRRALEVREPISSIWFLGLRGGI
ncbi:membrane bound O-acyl transferase family-domain-containing protein [Aspergillus carlsbadensis]|nr:membrane bound O-acyl transferase family-domain-containing protein [Aspergillus carlsbadensis]